MRKRIVFGLAVTLAVVVGMGAVIALPGIGVAALALVLALWLTLTRAGRRVVSMTASGMASLPQRLGGSLVVVVGIAGVVGVFVSLLAMGKGYERTFRATGSPTRAIVLRSGAMSEGTSTLGPQSVMLISGKPQVARDAQGQPLASPEVVVTTSLPKKGSGHDASVLIRGVGVRVWAVRPDVKIIAGRRFRTGMRELIVGKNAAQEFSQTGIGSTIRIDGQPWKIVGEFVQSGVHDSELWGDVNVMSEAFHRGSSVQSVTVTLTNAKAFDAFKAALATDPRLKVTAQTTREYYAAQSNGLMKTMRIVSSVVAAIMAIGAVAGALNSMYAAVAVRTREIATLRAIGFRGGPVVLSVMIETLLLAIGGGVVGAGIAWAVFHHFTASTLGANFSTVVFQFSVTPQLMEQGLRWAIAIGFVGGLLPALRAGRMPVTEGLREL